MMLTPEQRRTLAKKRAAAKYKRKLTALGAWRKGGRYFHKYDPIVDAPRRRRYYLNLKAKRASA